MNSNLWIIICLLFLLPACVHQQQPLSAKRLEVPRSSLAAPAAKPSQSGHREDEPPKTAAAAKVRPPVFTGVKPRDYRERPGRRPATAKPAFSENKMVSVAVDEMSLPDFVHYIFNDIFKVNYIVDEQVEKKREPVTLNLNREVSEDQLFGIVAEILEQHRLAVYAKDGIYYIAPKPKTQDIAVGIGATRADIPATAKEVKQIIPIKYANAQNLLEFLPRGNGIKIISSLKENLLLVTGSREQVEQVIGMLEFLDRPAMRGRFAGRIRLEYWSPEEMAAKLNDILTQEGLPVTRQPGKRGIYLNTLERWHSLLIFAAEKKWLDRVRYWVKLLDVPRDRDEKHYFLYFPENSRAAELGESLEKILGISESGAQFAAAPKKEAKAASVIPAAAPKKKAKAASVKTTAGHTLTTADVRVAVDENRNALIIYATPERYEALKQLLVRLDIMPVQVLIEATIAEVTLTGSLQYGLEWYLKNTDGNQTRIIKTLGGLGLGAGGLDASLITGSQKFQLAINALTQRDMVKILSSPRLMVRDGKSASITVGTEVPIITSEATSPDIQVEGSSGIIRSVQYRSTGVSLQLTAMVQARGIITLDITQEVSEAQANTTSDISSPIILNRTITTEVAAKNGQTILLGGMIKENQSTTVTGIPLLSEIPLLGHLFRTDSQGSDRTELVVMITPRIVRNSRQIDATREAIFESFQNLKIVK